MPRYDALSDPALAAYWARKFHWSMAGSEAIPGDTARPHDVCQEYVVEIRTSIRSPAGCMAKVWFARFFP